MRLRADSSRYKWLSVVESKAKADGYKTVLRRGRGKTTLTLTYNHIEELKENGIKATIPTKRNREERG